MGRVPERASSWCSPPHEFCQLFVNNFDKLLTRCETGHDLLTKRPLLDICNKPLDDLVMYVSLQEGHPDVAQTVCNIFF